MPTTEHSSILVTGIGVVAPNGIGPESFWESIIRGRSAAGPIKGLPVDDLQCRIGCQVIDFDPHEYISPKKARRIDRTSQLATAAAMMAFEDAGLDFSRQDPKRIGLCEGTSLGGSEWLFRQYDIYQERGLQRVNPFTITAAFVGSASGEIAIHLGIRGPCLTVCTGSASGADAVVQAMNMLSLGEADVVLAGGAEAPFVLPIVALFNRVGVLTGRNDDPAGACRPFDADRDGFVLGEGAAFLVLEREEDALERNAPIRVRAAGFGRTCDAYHMNAPDPEGIGASEAIQGALERSGLEADRIGYINAHGTATRLNDPMEAKAIRSSLGSWGEQVPVSSTKPVTGHLLGASGAVEAVAAVLAIQNQALPPNLNLSRPDPDCPLNLVSDPEAPDIAAALPNSYGFRGKNTSLIFSRYNR